MRDTEEAIMIQARLLMILPLLISPALGLTAALPAGFPVPEIVELSAPEREALLAAPRLAMNETASAELTVTAS